MSRLTRKILKLDGAFAGSVVDVEAHIHFARQSFCSSLSLSMFSGVREVHDFHAWSLTNSKKVASIHGLSRAFCCDWLQCSKLCSPGR